MTTCQSEVVIYDNIDNPAEYIEAYNALMGDHTNRLRVAAVVEICAT